MMTSCGKQPDAMFVQSIIQSESCFPVLDLQEFKNSACQKKTKLINPRSVIGVSTVCASHKDPFHAMPINVAS